MWGQGGFGAEVELSGPTDGISSLAWGQQRVAAGESATRRVAAGCWDNSAYVWDVQKEADRPLQANAIGSAQHAGPVLDVAWKEHDMLTASVDKTAKLWDVQRLGDKGYTGTQIAQHDAAIKNIRWINEMQLVVTGSWDKTLKYWDTRQQAPTATIQLPERCYSLDVAYPTLVCATANSHVYVYDLRNPQAPSKQLISPLRRQTRCVACFPDSTGFAIGSIEGRVGIQYIDNTSKNFAFKCHREKDGGKDARIFPINAITFHRQYGTFATCGADGAFAFWDKEKKQRLKQFPVQNRSISTAAFDESGELFAYARSYDWFKGSEHASPGAMNNRNATAVLRKVLLSEIQPK